MLAFSAPLRPAIPLTAPPLAAACLPPVPVPHTQVAWIRSKPTGSDAAERGGREEEERGAAGREGENGSRSRLSLGLPLCQNNNGIPRRAELFPRRRSLSHDRRCSYSAPAARPHTDASHQGQPREKASAEPLMQMSRNPVARPLWCRQRASPPGLSDRVSIHVHAVLLATQQPRVRVTEKKPRRRRRSDKFLFFKTIDFESAPRRPETTST